MYLKVIAFNGEISFLKSIFVKDNCDGALPINVEKNFDDIRLIVLS